MSAIPSILGPDGRPLLGPERVSMERRQRFNPLRGVTPDRLTQLLECWQQGHIRQLAWVMEWMEKHDDLISTSAAKAKAAVGRYGWDVVINDDAEDQDKVAAEEQRRVVRQFYRRLECRHATEGEQEGGMRMFVEQVLDGYGKGYAIHHLIWTPSAAGLRCQVLFVPLWYFETRRGRMAFLAREGAFDGRLLAELGGQSAWMVSVGRGVMLACAIAWMFKHIPLQDWLTYCDRHGMPGFLGKTSAGRNEPGWEMMATAVRSMGAEFAAVVNTGDAIEVIDLTAKGDIPYEALVDRMDRAIAMLWRGGDLSTISRGQDAVGSEAQASDTDDLDQDNAEWAGETIDRALTRRVIEWHFGRGTEPLVHLQLGTRTADSSPTKLRALEVGEKLGLRPDPQWFSEEFGIPLAKEPLAKEPLAKEPVAPQPVTQPAINETPREQELFAAGLGVAARQLEPVRELLGEIATAAADDQLDDETLLAHAETIIQRIPGLYDPALSWELATILEAAMEEAALPVLEDNPEPVTP